MAGEGGQQPGPVTRRSEPAVRPLSSGGAGKDNLEFSPSERLNLDQRDKDNLDKLKSLFRSQEEKELDQNALFMAPFWIRTLNSTYKLLAERKHEQFAKAYPNKPDNPALYEDAFRDLLKDYFQPAADFFKTHSSAYYEGITKYPTDSKILNGQDLAEDMEKASRNVIFGDEIDPAKKVYEELCGLEKEIGDSNLKFYMQLTTFLRQKEKLLQNDDLAHELWAVVAAPLAVYYRKFILVRLPSRSR